MTNKEIQDKVMEELKTKKIQKSMSSAMLSEKVGCSKDILEGNLQILREQKYVDCSESSLFGIVDVNKGELFMTYFIQDNE